MKNGCADEVRTSARLCSRCAPQTSAVSSGTSSSLPWLPRRQLGKVGILDDEARFQHTTEFLVHRQHALPWVRAALHLRRDEYGKKRTVVGQHAETARTDDSVDDGTCLRPRACSDPPRARGLRRPRLGHKSHARRQHSGRSSRTTCQCSCQKPKSSASRRHRNSAAGIEGHSVEKEP